LTVPTLPLTRPSLGVAELEAAASVLSGSQLTQGPQVASFETEFALYQDGFEPNIFRSGQPQRLHAVATNACTSALYLTLKALGIGPGDEVITTPLTWVATALAIRWTGAKVVFADVDADGLLDPDCCCDVLTTRTRAILPVHLWGNLCDIDTFKVLSEAEDVHIVFDCAHAIEARFDDEPLGGYGDAACYSFHATKNLTTAGEGGMVVTRNAKIAEYVRKARLFGITPGTRTCEQFGAKLNMTEVQAAVGRVQLRRLEERYARRLALWNAYHARLRYPRGICNATGTRDGLHLYNILCDDRDSVRGALERAGIGSGVHYAPLYDHPEFTGTKPRHAENADRIGRQTLSLPFFPEMAVEDVERVVAALESAP
jgi:dTDP-4-amino-4,6-dideoxygalactose transaminase